MSTAVLWKSYGVGEVPRWPIGMATYRGHSPAMGAPGRGPPANVRDRESSSLPTWAVRGLARGAPRPKGGWGPHGKRRERLYPLRAFTLVGCPPSRRARYSQVAHGPTHAASFQGGKPQSSGFPVYMAMRSTAVMRSAESTSTCGAPFAPGAAVAFPDEPRPVNLLSWRGH